MSAEKLDAAACLALIRDGAEVPTECAAYFSGDAPWFSPQDEGALILGAFLGLVVLGYFLIQTSQARRERLKSITTPKE
ncbi:MAG: hypothetical protein AAGE90_13030 [Pseudomonadota bacterium]